MSTYKASEPANGPVKRLRRLVSLALKLTQREVAGRYKGSFLGVGWSLLTPLLMLSVYTFVFGAVFKGRWAETVQTGSMIEFAIILFGGLIVFQMFSDAVIQSTVVIVANSGFVKKVVFPVQVLPVVTVLTALFHASVAMLVLFGFMLFEFKGIPTTAFYLPVVLLPLLMMVLGMAWLFSALGVFFRDIGQILGPIVTACLFLAPVFFPAKALPEWVRPLVVLNPITVPVEQFRRVVILGHGPDWVPLYTYGGIAFVIMCLGFLFFQSVRKGFADVL
ncbi:MAG: ABC transporter permease [Hyphomonas sp.]